LMVFEHASNFFSELKEHLPRKYLQNI